jgi:hypothetical protein
MLRPRATMGDGRRRDMLINVTSHGSKPHTRRRHRDSSARNCASGEVNSESPWISEQRSSDAARPSKYHELHVRVVEAIDLTGGDEIPLPPVPAHFIDTASKRKRDECRVHSSSERFFKSTHGFPRGCSGGVVGNFHDIDDFITEQGATAPNNAPLPQVLYSTSAHDREQKRRRTIVASDNAAAVSQLSGGQRPLTASCGRRSASCTSPESWAQVPARKHSRQEWRHSTERNAMAAESMCTATTRRFTHAVLDSEDEDEALSDSLDPLPEPPAGKSSCDESPSRDATKSPTRRQAPTRSPRKLAGSQCPHESKQRSAPVQEATNSLCNERLLPRKPKHESFAQPALSPSALSKEQRASIHKAVASFLEADADQHLHSINVAWEKAKTAFVEQMGVDGPNPRLKEHLGHLWAKKAAAERLARLREQYSKAATERDVWREHVRDAIEVGIYEEADLAALRTVSKALEDIAVQVHHHLAIAGIHQLSSTESSSQ